MAFFRRCALIFTFTLALPAFPQLDSFAVRAKLGVPLNRETFHLPQGFTLIADYGSASQLCRVEVPALMPAKATAVSNTDDMNRKMHEFLLDLIPLSQRGKELRRSAMISGIVSVTVTEYEKLDVSELNVGDPMSRDWRITIVFKDDRCEKPPEP
jgi:hypothetical protein